jgi:uncharacterized BrkB/YihY/UPF0761 family membrane protein
VNHYVPLLALALGTFVLGINDAWSAQQRRPAWPGWLTLVLLGFATLVYALALFGAVTLT